MLEAAGAATDEGKASAGRGSAEDVQAEKILHESVTVGVDSAPQVEGVQEFQSNRDCEQLHSHTVAILVTVKGRT